MLQQLLSALPEPESTGRLLSAVFLAALAGLLGFVVHLGLRLALRIFVRRTSSRVASSFLVHCRRPMRHLLPVLFAALAVASLRGEGPLVGYLGAALRVLLIVTFSWFLVGLTGVMRDEVLAQFPVDVSDNLEARKVRTQMAMVRRILTVAISVFGLALVLMTFEPLRELGTGLLASAGLAGLVIGFAAQKALGNLLAGFQIAFTQPVRLDDVVVVEGEWGRIEELTLTYVVVRIWDERRLVLPIGYLLENAFENWTRVSAELLGTVYLRLDYVVPIDAIRGELERIVRESEHWDGRVWRVHVTDAGERTLEVRALVSGADSGAVWELRCEVREKLVDWVRRAYPEALPRVRAQMQPLPA